MINSRRKLNTFWYREYQGFPGGAVVKNPPDNSRDARDMGSSPGSGRSPRVGNGNPLQYSCPGNSKDRTEEPVWLQSTETQRVRHD